MSAGGGAAGEAAGAPLRLTFLGTGTSVGVPVIGCGCRVCGSDDPRDRRTRHGALLRAAQGNLLIDTPPELRLQLLACGVDRVDAVWYTHLHADHVHGIDDVRIFSARTGRALPAHVPPGSRREMRERFPYIFRDPEPPPPGTTRPRLDLRAYRDGEATALLGESITPFRVPHGPGDAHGFRIRRLGYVTDAKSLPAEAREILAGVEFLVLNALWWGRPHPTHFNVQEAIEVSRDIGARRTFLTHLTHKMGHGDLAASLPDGIEPAYDGLSVDIA